MYDMVAKKLQLIQRWFSSNCRGKDAIENSQARESSFLAANEWGWIYDNIGLCPKYNIKLLFFLIGASVPICAFIQ